MEGMDMGPGTDLGGFGWFAGIWAVMMAAMMLPSLAPKATIPFAAGFLLPWALAGVAAYGLVEGVRSLDPAFLAWDRAGRWVAAAVVLGAAAYELTSPKRSCLERCREQKPPPPGALNALRTGIGHGLICIGCCWALMAALFALGVMSLGWMVLIAAVIALDKLLPRPDAATRVAAGLLVVLGLAVALVPEQVPGLTLPGELEMTGMTEAG
jgi:predicted metal-binding membrane protein